jgi:hypothetical protein
MYEVCIYMFSVDLFSFIYLEIFVFLVFMLDSYYVSFKYFIVDKLGIGELRVM